MSVCQQANLEAGESRMPVWGVCVMHYVIVIVEKAYSDYKGMDPQQYHLT